MFQALGQLASQKEMERGRPASIHSGRCSVARDFIRFSALEKSGTPYPNQTRAYHGNVSAPGRTTSTRLVKKWTGGADRGCYGVHTEQQWTLPA